MVRRLALTSALLFLALMAWGILTAEPGNDFHFSIIGDRTGRAAPEVYRSVWREVALLGPAFAINVGDTIEGGVDDRAEREWAEVEADWKPYRSFPFYLVPGNHDIWSDRSRRIFEKVNGRPAHYSFVHQDALFVVLDNSRTEDLDEQQLRFLESELKANRGRAPKFVFFHKPYWLLYLKVGSGEFPLHRLARQYGVNYVVSGHGHQFVRLARDGVVYLEIGSSGGDMSRGLSRGEGFADGWFYHHAWVRVKGSEARVTIRELGPPHGQGRIFDAGTFGQ